MPRSFLFHTALFNALTVQQFTDKKQKEENIPSVRQEFSINLNFKLRRTLQFVSGNPTARKSLTRLHLFVVLLYNFSGPGIGGTMVFFVFFGSSLFSLCNKTFHHCTRTVVGMLQLCFCSCSVINFHFVFGTFRTECLARVRTKLSLPESRLERDRARQKTS